MRAVRLRALSDAPYAFATTFEQAQEDPDETWQALAARRAVADNEVTFIAIQVTSPRLETWYAMVGAFLVDEEPGTVQLVSLWVDPAYRRSGIGSLLVQAIIDWAATKGAERVSLWVTESNGPAKALYERAGFLATDRSRPLPSNPGLSELLMVKPLLTE